MIDTSVFTSVRNSGVTLVAVTKSFPFSRVREAYDTGIRDIGENRAEEAEEKIQEAREHNLNGIVWHMIGHVQGRKVKKVTELFDRIDSVDTTRLARRLDHEAGIMRKHIGILLEINLSGEKTKYGFDLVGWRNDPDKLDRFLRAASAIAALPNLKPEGLMTMAPRVTDAAQNIPIFRDMTALSKTIRAQNPGFGPIRSMGTSRDYMTAIGEGATEVRLGEALFGLRTAHSL